MSVMRKAGTLTLVLLLVFGVVVVGLSACRGFMNAECMAQMAGTDQDLDQCKKMCQLGQDERPALLEKAQPKFSSDTVASLVHLFTLPEQLRLHSILEGSKLDVHNQPPRGEVYLLNAAFLI